MEILSSEQRKQFPNFICVGPPKTATTFLDSVLKSDERIFLPRSKESHYFSYFQSIGLDGYLNFYEGAESFLVRGDISPSYFHHLEAANRIKEIAPESKIIICVRNPIELVYSLFWQLKRHNFYQSKENDINISFRDALVKYAEILISPAQYSLHVERWKDVFTAKSIHLFFFSDLKDRPVEATKDLLAFLGLDRTISPSVEAKIFTPVLSGVSPRSGLVGKFYGNFYGLINSCIFMPMKRIIGYNNALAVKDFFHIREVFGKVFFKSGYKPISKEDVSFLETILAEDIAYVNNLSAGRYVN